MPIINIIIVALLLLSPMFFIVLIALASGSLEKKSKLVPPVHSKSERMPKEKVALPQPSALSKKTVARANERNERLVPLANSAFGQTYKKTPERLVPPANFVRMPLKPLSLAQIRFNKAVRVLSAVLGVLCALSVFMISACTFFSSNAAMHYIELQLERYNTVHAVKGYMTASFVCMGLSAVCVAFAFVGFSELVKVNEYGASLTLLFILHIPLILWAAFFENSSLSQCLVTVIISTVFLCVHAALMFFFVMRSKKLLKTKA